MEMNEEQMFDVLELALMDPEFVKLLTQAMHEAAIGNVEELEDDFFKD